MIVPKVSKVTPRMEREAYMICTDRDDNTCQKCLRNCGPVQRDHRRNRSQGGLTLASNLQCLGQQCHTWKSEHPLAAIRDGWAVPGYADPLTWPARRYEPTTRGTVRPVWVLYDDLGDYRIISDERAEALMTGSTRWN